MECHDDIEEDMSAAASSHAPVAEGECSNCHNPHKGMIDSLLVAESPELCFGCHENIEEKLATEREHDPAAEDCMNCHRPHFSGNPSLVSLPIGELCADCHDTEDEDFGAAHLEIDAAVMDCIGCHAPHASKDPKFFKEKMHSPFVKGDCGECHVVERGRGG
jgi:predicted CXXCH cytochrome family protein